MNVEVERIDRLDFFTFLTLYPETMKVSVLSHNISYSFR